MAPTFETLLLTEPEPGIALLTLNRPERLNAISVKLLEEFGEVLRLLDLLALEADQRGGHH